MDETAETLLQQFQQTLRSATTAVRDAERSYGAQATRAGRRLSDLLAGSPAWDLFEKPGRSRQPRLHELCGAEPVLQAMRESGELTERERLLEQRDNSLTALWEREATEEDRWIASEEVHDAYFAAIRQAAETVRPHYEALRRAVSGHPAPLAGPHIRSRLLLLPPLMALLYRACHEDGDEVTLSGNAICVQPVDTALLDAQAWDSAALALCAFFARTDGTCGDTVFPFFLDDYFLWRGVDPRKRSQELRRQIAARIELLCSDRLLVRSETALWRTDPATGRRSKTPVQTEGPILVKQAALFRTPSVLRGAEPEVSGFLLSLGTWAAPLVEERAMLGLYPKRLAEYDLQRQQWERRIGWYLVFQMNNQGSKMTFQETVKDGRTRMQVTPQHPLKMKTVLGGSLIPWEATARTNPGKVINQWTDALETLRRDGIIGSCLCLDGPPDGSDLPERGRLAAMLERRYQFTPGKDLLPHLLAKRNAAQRKRPA